tara:strand:- start:451 stop:615 length:165 start_codon:yes stop_codon:yes gene_type:complete
MDGQIQMAIYRIESIVNRVNDVVPELEKLLSAHNLTDKQKEDLEKEIKLLKEIQ